MRNLTGYLKKTLLLFSSILLFSVSTSTILAQQENFSFKTEIYHTWKDDTLTTTIYYTISTKDIPRVITYYTTTLLEENIKPQVILINKNKTLEPTYHSRNQATDIVLDLENTPVSKENPITLKMTYTKEFTEEKLSLLSSIQDTKTSKLTFTYPKDKGSIGWSSTPVTKIESKGNNYVVVIDNPQGEKTTFTLGREILYKFHITRNLINTSNNMFTSEILIPPNTTFQKIVLESFQPQPNRSYKDINGNYVLQYELAGDSNLTVDITGYIKMERGLELTGKQYSTITKEFWKLTSEEEKKRFNKFLTANNLKVDDGFDNINELKDNSEKELFYLLTYRYILSRLEPNTLTLGSLTGGVRLGATKALEALSPATAEDYSDSLIALLREYEVPSRFVIGYVTNISDYNPDGMYHTWVEFFDSTKGTWIVADPFLEDYSSTSLWRRDLPDHVAILYRYENPNTPKLPYYSENDFQIEKVGELPESKYSLEASLSFKPYSITDSHLRGSIAIKNTGNTVLDAFNIFKSNPDLTKYLDNIENSNSMILLPDDTGEIHFNIPSKDIDSNIFAVIKASSGTVETDEKYISSQFDIIAQNSDIDTFSKLISALMYIIISIPIYLILKKLQTKNG